MYTSLNNILTREDCSLTPILPNSNQGVQPESKGVKFKESEVMVYGYIYKIVNTLDNKVYIGQTIQTPDKRWKNHLRELNGGKHYNIHLQNAFKKYGEVVFKFVVLNYGTTKEALDKLEEDYIRYYNCLNSNYGYNIREGGAHGKLSIETRKKMSEAKKGEKCYLYKKSLSIEHRKKISENNACFWKDKKRSLKTCKKIRNSKRGKSLFGFTGAYLDKQIIPENKPWRSTYFWRGHLTRVGPYEDPLSCQIVRDLIYDATFDYL
jgi:group I intron endonuclease